MAASKTLAKRIEAMKLAGKSFPRLTRNLGFKVKGLVGALFLLLAFVSLLSYTSLRQSTNQISLLSKDALPSLASTMELSLYLERIIQSSERLMNAKIQAEQRIAFQQTTEALEAGKAFIMTNTTVASSQQLQQILATLDIAANDLNTLIQEKMEVAARVGRKRQELISLLQSSRAYQAAADPNSPEEAEFQSFQKLFQATSLTLDMNARDLRRNMTRLERALGDIEAKLDSGPASWQRTLLDKLTTVLSGPDGFFALLRLHSTQDLRAVALTRQMRVITAEMVRELEALTTGKIEEIQLSTNYLIDRAEQRLDGLVFVVFAAISIALITFLYIDRRVVRRLHDLQENVQKRAAGEEVSIASNGADEITEIAKAVQHFIGEIDLREKSLIETAEKAKAAAQAKSSFLAMMSHEIRSPMNGIISVAEILSREPLEGEQRRLVNVINQSAETLLTIINDILDLSKIEANKLAIETFDFDLHELLQSTIELLTPELEQKGLTHSLEIDSDVPKWVQGDANRLRQILFNLIGNAAKFTHKGSVRVRAFTGNAGQVNIDVIDTGVGIPEEVSDRLFQPFEQADSSTARQFGGTGLGLSICKKLATLMKGDLCVRSEVGKGSTFTLTLPFLTSEERHLDSASETPQERLPAPADRKILVVEDNPINQMVIGKILSKMAVRFQTASDGQEALTKLEEDHYDMVMTDLRMPIMDGFTLARAIRAGEAGSGRRMPIIAISADALEEAKAASIASGIDTFIAKPVKIDEIRDCLDEFLPG